MQELNVGTVQCRYYVCHFSGKNTFFNHLNLEYVASFYDTFCGRQSPTCAAADAYLLKNSIATLDMTCPR